MSCCYVFRMTRLKNLKLGCCKKPCRNTFGVVSSQQSNRPSFSCSRGVVRDCPVYIVMIVQVRSGSNTKTGKVTKWSQPDHRYRDRVSTKRVVVYTTSTTPWYRHIFLAFFNGCFIKKMKVLSIPRIVIKLSLGVTLILSLILVL